MYDEKQRTYYSFSYFTYLVCNTEGKIGKSESLVLRKCIAANLVHYAQTARGFNARLEARRCIHGSPYPRYASTKIMQQIA